MSLWKELYYILIKLVLLIGLLFVVIASNYTCMLLTVLTGKYQSNNIKDASNALYSFYVLSTTLNGMIEAFVYGIISGTSNRLKSNKTLDIGKLDLAYGIDKLKIS